MRNSARDKFQRSWNTKTREHTAKMTREQIRGRQDKKPAGWVTRKDVTKRKSPEKRTSKWHLFFFWEALESRIMPSVGRSKEQASLPAAGDRGDQHRHSEKLASIFFFFPQIKYFIPAAQLFPSWVNMSEQFSPGTRRGCVCLLGTAWPGGGGVVGIWLWLLWLEAGDSMYTSQDGDA